MNRWDGGYLPDGITFCRDPETFSSEWNRFADVIAKELGGTVSALCPGVSIRYNFERSSHLDGRVARCVFRLATGKPYKAPKDKAA